MANPRYNTQTTNPRQKLASGGRAKAMGGGVMRRDMASGYYPSDMGMSGGAQSKGEGYDKGQGIGLNRVIERKNTHPTVKPVELMKYLCRMVTPKGGTVLDPFMGSGSTGMAAKDEGFDFIGIEKEKEYFEICESRIKRFAPLMDFM